MTSKPSDSELKLLKRLWRAERLSAREIHDASAPETGWSYSTTRKSLDRMVDKGLLRIEHVHGVKTFAATQSKLETLAGLVRHFARTVLDADAALPAAAFAGSRILDAEEIEELEALLEGRDADDGDAA